MYIAAPSAADCADGCSGPLVAGVAVGSGVACSVITLLVTVTFVKLRNQLLGIPNMVLIAKALTFLT